MIELHKIVGNKWIKIAHQLPGRSYNRVKNHWNTTKRRVQKQISENVNHDNNILENYIRYVIINNDDPPKTTESNAETIDIEEDDDHKDMFVEEMNLSLDARSQTNELLVNVSTTSPYVLMPEMFTSENGITEFCGPVDEIQNMHWWK